MSEQTHFFAIRDINEEEYLATGMKNCEQYLKLKTAEKNPAYKAIEKLADLQTLYDIRSRIDSLNIGEKIDKELKEE
jgi:hypothetical protein